MRKRLHVFGASGSGTSTLARAVAEKHGLTCFEADELERLRHRETARFGDRLFETGDILQQHSALMTWASQYDEGSMTMRSRRLHEEWLLRLPCPVARVDGSVSVEVLCAQLSEIIAA